MERGLSLRELAARSGLSPALISQVERGLTEPSLTTLRKIATSLSVPLFSLIAQEDHQVVVVRCGKRMVVHENGVSFARLSPSTGAMEMLEGTLAPHTRSAPEPRSHAAHECVLVTEGAVVVTIGRRRVTLSRGDSCYFDSRHAHFYENRTDEPARYILAVTPPSY